MLQGMNARAKAVETRQLAKLCDVLNASEHERKEILEGGPLHLDLDLSSNYIVGTSRYPRAIQGVIPRFEGDSNFRGNKKR